MGWTADQTYRFTFQTVDSDGAPADADTTPTGTLYVNGASTASIVTITDSGTGWYRGSVSLTGRSVDDVFEVEVTATIDSTAYIMGMGSERIDSSVDSRNATTPPTAVAIRTEIDSNSTKLAEVTAARMGALTDWIDGGRLDTLLDALTSTLGVAGAGLTALPGMVEAAFVNEADSTAAMQALADKIAGDLVVGDLTAMAIASAVRVNLATELARIDVDISSRLATSGYTAPPSATENRDAVLDRALAGNHDTAGTPGAFLQVISTLLTAGGYTAPPDTAAIQAASLAALLSIHLDHLFADDYDPADKPGVGTALLNELIEDDAGVSRLTANALEQAPIFAGAPVVWDRSPLSCFNTVQPLEI